MYPKKRKFFRKSKFRKLRNGTVVDNAERLDKNYTILETVRIIQWSRRVCAPSADRYSPYSVKPLLLNAFCNIKQDGMTGNLVCQEYQENRYSAVDALFVTEAAFEALIALLLFKI